MKNNGDSSDILHKKLLYQFTPLITTVAFPLLIGRRKNEKDLQEKSPKFSRPKSKGLAIIKFEVTGDKIKFFDAKGFPKKRWVLIKEIPIQEISGVESFGNELKITWNEEIYTFVSKKKYESFNSLRDQIQSLLVEQPKNLENNEKLYLTKNDLTKLMGVIDLSFDILIGLNEKTINWANLESYSEGLLDNWKLDDKSPLNLNFVNVSASVKSQIVEETSKEAYGILKSIYEYFVELKPEANKENSVNIPDAKNLILAYYMLNDILFGKVVGEMNNEKETSALERVLVNLANGSNVKFNIEEVKSGISRLAVEVDYYRIFKDIRARFKENLSLL